MAVDTRPTTLTAVHNYNLRNQGWPNEFPCLTNQAGNGGPDVVDPVPYTFDINGWYPSNADIIYYAKATSVNDAPSLDAYSPWSLRTVVTGNTPAGKGHFIINAFDRNRQAVSGIDGIYDPAVDTTNDRPVSVAFYAGRIWYLMPEGDLYFSQSLTEVEKAEKCYQDADPTAEDINELIATDGGELDISDISQGLKLVPIRAEIAIMADNGVWAVSGDGDQSFTATSQEIRQITTTGALGPDAVVEAEDLIFYWSDGGIYALVPNQVTGLLEAQNLSEQTVQSFYLNIPVSSRKNARGFYDEEEKKIYWFYAQTPPTEGVNYWKNRYTHALVYDVVLQAFYTYSFTEDTTYPHVSAMFQKTAGNTATTETTVTDSTVPVTDGGIDLTAEITLPESSDIKLKFLTFVETSTNVFQYTFSELRNNNMLDWYTFDSTGLDYSSYLETGHDIFEDLISEIEANIVYTFFKRTEENFTSVGGLVSYDFPSSCLMQAQWHWTDSSTAGRWTDAEQAYRLQRYYVPPGSGAFDYGFEVIETANNVRGKGRALSLRFESEAGKDFHLLGWGIPATLMVGY